MKYIVAPKSCFVQVVEDIMANNADMDPAIDNLMQNPMFAFGMFRLAITQFFFLHVDKIIIFEYFFRRSICICK